MASGAVIGIIILIIVIVIVVVLVLVFARRNRVLGDTCEDTLQCESHLVCEGGGSTARTCKAPVGQPCQTFADCVQTGANAAVECKTTCNITPSTTAGGPCSAATGLGTCVAGTTCVIAPNATSGTCMPSAGTTCGTGLPACGTGLTCDSTTTFTTASSTATIPAVSNTCAVPLLVTCVPSGTAAAPGQGNCAAGFTCDPTRTVCVINDGLGPCARSGINLQTTNPCLSTSTCVVSSTNAGGTCTRTPAPVGAFMGMDPMTAANMAAMNSATYRFGRRY